MSLHTNACLVSAILPRSVAEEVQITERLQSAGLEYFSVATSRETYLEEKPAFLGLIGGGIRIGSDPAEAISFIVNPQNATGAIGLIIEAARLTEPGRGMIALEDVSLIANHPLCGSQSLNYQAKEARSLGNLSAIVCIVARGQADNIARVALDTGSCVPAVFFGTGTGLRDKLGLLRITIPGDKDVVQLLTSSADAEGLMDLMIDAGQLDQPGKGFIYMYPVRDGVVNSRVNRASTRQAASAEQMIAAIDELKGGMEWRRKGLSDGKTSARAYLRDLLDLTIVCDEGKAVDLVASAMAAGAGGATITKVRHVARPGSPSAKVSRSREVSSMIVSEAQISGLRQALEDDGAFSDACHGQLFVRTAPKACTFLGKS